jgi:tetratricopeptide (TPR) repeat protein/predicted Ser/Thr protein kinase
MLGEDMEELGRYQIQRELGRGGEGVVYLAQDPALGRPVAIKTLLLGVEQDPTGQLRQKLFREAQSAGRLSHPHIVTVHEYVEQDSGGCIVMEYIDGESLDRAIELGRPPGPEQLPDLLIQAASALDYAHSQGVIHRDIKPANLMLTKLGHIKIADFGIAKVLHDDVSLKTRTGMVRGTPHYLAPEQADGKPITGLTDQYALGVAFYYLLTGQLPFQGDTWSQLLTNILTKEPPPVQKYRPELPEAVDNVMRRVLAKMPEERFPNCSAFAQAFREAMAGGEFKIFDVTQRAGVPLPSGQTKAVETARPAGVPRRWVWAAGGTAFAAGAGYWAFRQFGGARTIQSLAVLPFANRNNNAEIDYLVDGITDQLIYGLTSVKDLVVRSRAAVAAYRKQPQDLAEVAQKLKVDGLVTGSVQIAGDTLRVTAELTDARENRLVWGDNYERRSDSAMQLMTTLAYDIAQKLRAQLSGAEQERLRRQDTQNSEAHRLYLQGRYQLNRRTQEGTLQAIDLFQQALGIDPQYALAHAGLADAFTQRSGSMAPTQIVPKAIESVQAALRIDPNLAEAYLSRAFIALNYLWDWRGAESDYQRATELKPSYALAHSGKARYYLVVGRFDEAIATYRRALELDPLSIVSPTGIATAHYYAGRLPQAREQVQRAVDTDPKFLAAQVTRAEILAASGDLPGALKTLETARQLAPSDSGVLSLSGLFAARAKQTPEARQYLQRLDELAKQRYVSPVFYAYIHLGLGDLNQVFRYLEKGIEDRTYAIIYLKHNPLFAPVRNDPRYAALVKRLGL